MENNWREFLIEDLCSIRRGASPRPIKDFIKPDGVIPWVKISDATASDSRYITRTGEKIIELGRNKSVEVTKGDLILSNSATPGLPKIMKIDACIHDGWLLLREFEGILKEYMYYLLINEREKIVGYANGTVFQNLKTDILRKFKVKIPKIKEQQKIVSILSLLDDKIELNNEMNKTLEQMAQAIFKSWFVDFEPFKDGEFEESELGRIPKGWKVDNINSIVDATDYVANGSFAALKQNVAYSEREGYAILIRLVDYNKGFNEPFKYVDKKGYEFLKKSKLFGGEIIISNVGANAGTVFKAPKLDVPMTLGPNSIMLIPNNYSNYLYLFLTSRDGQEKLKSILSGSAQPKFNKTDFRNIKIVIPPIKIVESFNKIINSFMDKFEETWIENRQLEQIRDTLLPKLISGKIKL